MHRLNGRHFALVLLAVGLWLVPRGQVAAQHPQPDVVSGSWELHFSWSVPRVVSVKLTDAVKPKLYWYMPYTVTNKTGQDQLFVPDIYALTDAGDLIQSNKGVPPRVFKAIQAREKNALLERPSRIVGRLLQGANNGRDGVAVWPVPDHDVDRVVIFFGGLSGETHQMYQVKSAGDSGLFEGSYVSLKRLTEMNAALQAANDTAREINPAIAEAELKKLAEAVPTKVLLRKTLMITYDTPGDVGHAAKKPFVLKGKRWVLR